MNDFDHQMVRALAHPLRVEILRQLEKGPTGPKRIADQIDQKLSNVSYHVRVLLKCGCIELVEVLPQRGAVEHIYRLKSGKSAGPSAWLEVPPSFRTDLAKATLADFTKRAVEAFDAGTAENRKDSGVSWLPLSIDEQGWKELTQLRQRVEKASAPSQRKAQSARAVRRTIFPCWSQSRLSSCRVERTSSHREPSAFCRLLNWPLFRWTRPAWI